jgi:hypothetical protein
MSGQIARGRGASPAAAARFGSARTAPAVEGFREMGRRDGGLINGGGVVSWPLLDAAAPIAL